MNRPLEVGVTGGIGSGKSIVCRIFHCLEIPVYDADSRAKVLMTTDGILVEEIKKEFGNLSYHVDGSLNRIHLRQVAFGNPERLNTLNGLVHPRVALDYETWVIRHQDYPYIVREAALIFEAGVNRTLGRIVVVYAPQSIRIRRVLTRDPQRTEEEVRKIIDSQWADEKKMKMADAIIYNDEQQLVTPQVLALHRQFLSIR